MQSLSTPTTPRPPSSHDRIGGFNFSSDFGGLTDAENGLGSLADELAEAWYIDDDGEGEEDWSGIQAEDEELCTTELEETSSLLSHDQDEKDIIGLAISLGLKEKPGSTQSPTKHGNWRKTQWKETGCNSSENSEHFDNEKTGMPASLETWMAVIHALAKQGAVLTGITTNGVFVRVTDSLKDLTTQAGIESHSTR